MSRSTRDSNPRRRKGPRSPTRKETNYYIATMLRELARLAREGGREPLALRIEAAAREAEDDDTRNCVH